MYKSQLDRQQLAESINTERSGFYKGFNRIVAVAPKLLIGALIIWVGLSPSNAAQILLEAQNWSTETFGGWYIFVTAFYACVCLILGLWPRTAHIKLGMPDETPEFSTLSWLSMMFSAGIGVGMLTYSTAEPIFHFANNPDTIKGLSVGLDENNVRNAYKWVMLHYGFTPWACYGVIGISLGYLSYSHHLPLTIRSALQPLFGRAMTGGAGHAADIFAILATIVGLSVTIGYGVSQFASGLFNITGMTWLIDGGGKPTLIAQLTGLILIVCASCLSAASGLKRGIKWLSNINMSLSAFLIVFFVLFGATFFALKTFFYTIWDYLIALPAMSTSVWRDTGIEPSKALQECRVHGQSFIGLGGSPSHPLLGYSWHAFLAAEPFVSMSSVRLLFHP